MTDRTEPNAAAAREAATPGLAGPATGAARPLVVVCLRPADPAMRVDPLTGWIDRDPDALDLPAADAAALEYALRFAAAWPGRVLAVTAGDESADGPLRQVLALGAEVLRVPWPPAPGSAGHAAPAARAAHRPSGDVDEAYVAELAAGEQALAATLAAAIRGAAGPEGPALVLCGDRSAERGTGAVPAFLAHELGAAQALGLIRLEASDDHLLAERRLDGGRRERLRVPLPAVCSVEAAGVRLRRAGLPGLLMAASAAVPKAAPQAGGAGTTGSPSVPGRAHPEAGRARPYRPPTRVVPPPAGAQPRERLLQLTGALVAHEPPTVVGPVGAAEAADALLDFLRRTGYLDAEADAPGDPAGAGATNGTGRADGTDGTDGTGGTGPGAATGTP